MSAAGHLPARSETQRMDALRKAQATRLAMARVKRELSEMDRPDALDHVAYLVDERDPRIRRMTVRQLLLAIPGTGDGKLHDALDFAGIESQDEKVCRLRLANRTDLAFWLRGTATWTRAKRAQAERRAAARERAAA